jgi:hypothetical protein
LQVFPFASRIYVVTGFPRHQAKAVLRRHIRGTQVPSFPFPASNAVQKKPQSKGEAMHPEDLMKPDLLSRALLLGGGLVILVALLLIVLAAFTRASALS